MNTDAAVTWLTWIVAALGAAALVGVVLVRRWAGRLAVLGVAALLVIGGLAVRSQLSSLPTDSPRALCTGGVSWFGITLSGPSDVCARYR
jgi:hypothetical protein